jgi:hypothetical protein
MERGWSTRDTAATANTYVVVSDTVEETSISVPRGWRFCAVTWVWGVRLMANWDVVVDIYI